MVLVVLVDFVFVLLEIVSDGTRVLEFLWHISHVGLQHLFVLVELVRSGLLVDVLLLDLLLHGIRAKFSLLLLRSFEAYLASAEVGWRLVVRIVFEGFEAGHLHFFVPKRHWVLHHIFLSHPRKHQQEVHKVDFDDDSNDGPNDGPVLAGVLR